MTLAPSNGPIWHAAEFFFLYAGAFGDTVFIRISLILAQILIFVWTVCGTPQWPDFANERAAFHPDAFVWCGLCIIIAAVPLFQQLAYRDSNTEFDCGSMTHMAEALWRNWFRRSGIPRSDFKKILDCGEWVELYPGSSVPMFSSAEQAEAAAAEETKTSYGDVYYYVVDGQLDCTSHYKEGVRNFIARPGSFADAMSLIGFLGQPTAALAMQMGPLDVKVSLTSSFSLIVPTVPEGCDSPGASTSPNPSALASPILGSPGGALRRASGMLARSRSGNLRRSSSTEFAKKGALLLRFHKKDLLEKVLCTSGLASSAMRLIVTQSTLDNLFCESITACQPAVRRRYDVIHDMRRRLNNAPLSVHAADSKHSIWQQWWRAHVSILDFWRPGPEQRAMNAQRLVTTEKAEMDELRVHESELERLREVGTPLSSPHGSKNNLLFYGGSHSGSAEDMSSVASSPRLSALADPMGRESSIGNLATLGEETEFSRQESITLNQESTTPRH